MRRVFVRRVSRCAFVVLACFCGEMASAAVSEPIDVFAHPERCWLWSSEAHGTASDTAYLRFPDTPKWSVALSPQAIPIPFGSTALLIDGVTAASNPDGSATWYTWACAGGSSGISHELSLVGLAPQTVSGIKLQMKLGHAIFFR